MGDAAEKLLKRGIEIRRFTPELQRTVTELNREERYTVRGAMTRGLQAPFLHILAGIWIVIFWKTYVFDFPRAIVVGYLCAILSFLSITYVLLTTKLTSYGHIGEINARERGMVWVAMDVTKKPTYVTGMIGVQPLSMTHARLVRYMVRSPYRGMGIGRGLLDTALQFTVDEGYETVEVIILNISGGFKVLPMYARRGFYRHRTRWVPSTWMPMYKSQIMIMELNPRYFVHTAD